MPIYRMFEGLSKSEIDRIFDLGVIRPISEGELIFRKGDVGHEMFVILTGKVDIVDDLGENVGIVAELAPGEVLGEMAIFEKSHKRSAHALAREPSQVLVLSANMLNELLEQEIPKRFLINIIGLLCNRLRITNSMYMRAKYADKRGPRVK
ncbi:MAG: cyclic nucleotide-binding domain-containing protein [Candidatus Hydrogenedentota bacterium]|nr:MAG: cyclic nucleotide-binding domain-containing protein [Candidatus Hydrogenedentota bacterium]